MNVAFVDVSISYLDIRPISCHIYSIWISRYWAPSRFPWAIANDAYGLVWLWTVCLIPLYLQSLRILAEKALLSIVKWREHDGALDCGL